MKDESDRFDFVGVGIGPFNLSLAALSEPVRELRCRFYERNARFDWHPGLLLEGTTLQVPFLADLVTMADPTSRWSYLNYLHEHARLYRFYFYERFKIPRREYNRYCRWVSEQLSTCRFGAEVRRVEFGSDGETFDVTVSDVGGGGERVVRAGNVVLGVGSTPSVPACFEGLEGDAVRHTARYLEAKTALQRRRRITVIGSGQSAAEVFLDLLAEQPRHGYRVDWFTRGSGFLPMEYSKLGLEHFSPEYTDYFHGLPESVRDRVRFGQDLWYKGIAADTIAAIYDLLYERTVDGGEPAVHLRSRCEVRSCAEAAGAYRLRFRHLDQETDFEHETDAVVLGTGYAHGFPPCLAPMRPKIALDEAGRPLVQRDYALELHEERPGRIYVQNAELHTHGIGAPDLGLGAHRSARILNAIANREIYAIRRRNVFQEWGAPAPEDGARRATESLVREGMT